MNILYITAACLTKNTSANMSHNAFVQGLLENGVTVDIIMANDSWGEEDKVLKRWDEANYYEYNSISFSDRIRKRFASSNIQTTINNSTSCETKKTEVLSLKTKIKKRIRLICKIIFYTFFKPHPIYPLNNVWLKNASHFKCEKHYDLVISNSSPAASHKLASILIKKRNIHYKRWIQIWEDPWYHDLYGGHSIKILQEEDSLLKAGEEILYVSPLTLYYQKKHFPKYAQKMGFIPLPSMLIGNRENEITSEISFGYFGDYYSHTRNLKPFYDALLRTGMKGYIYGDSDIALSPSSNIDVSGRVTLDVLEKVQDRTSVLIHLCNLRGGQIPGKIYHYSATSKPILFILDGNEEEKNILKKYFGKYHRYIFCENNENEITKAILSIAKNLDKYYGEPVEAFYPKNVVSSFINKK